MATEGHPTSDSLLHRSGLRLSGRENQDIRLLIRMTRRRFTAINESGLPFLSGLCTIAQKHPSVRAAMLALAGTLRPWLTSSATPAALQASSTAGGTDNQIQHAVLSSSALERYQSALTELRSNISKLDIIPASSDDVMELLSSVLVLITAGFPNSSLPNEAADWTLHIAGIVSLIESLDQYTIQTTYVSRLARETAAHLDIGAFSLGSSGKTRSRGVWLKWNIEPPEAPQRADLSPTEVMLGYPRSLVTVIAAISALLEPNMYDDIDLSIQDVILRLCDSVHHKRQDGQALSRAQHQDESPVTRQQLFSYLEIVLDLWQQPFIPPRISTPVRIALVAAWEIMRKAALIYLWRRGLGSNILHLLPSIQVNTISKFISEMILSLRTLLHLYDEQEITIMNIMTWPVVVTANECSNQRGLQAEITSLLQGMFERFGIQHLKHLIAVLQELWRRAELDEGNRYYSDLSMESIAGEMGLCLPLF